MHLPPHSPARFGRFDRLEFADNLAVVGNAHDLDTMGHAADVYAFAAAEGAEELSRERTGVEVEAVSANHTLRAGRNQLTLQRVW